MMCSIILFLTSVVYAHCSLSHVTASTNVSSNVSSDTNAWSPWGDCMCCSEVTVGPSLNYLEYFCACKVATRTCDMAYSGYNCTDSGIEVWVDVCDLNDLCDASWEPSPFAFTTAVIVLLIMSFFLIIKIASRVSVNCFKFSNKCTRYKMKECHEDPLDALARDDLEPSKPVHPTAFFVLEFFTFAVGISTFLYALGNTECYAEYICFRNLMFGSFACCVCLCMLILNHRGWFQILVDKIQSRRLCCNLKLQVVVISSFLLLGLIDFFLLSISVACMEGDTECDEPLLDPNAGNGEVRHITRTLTAVCAILFVFTLLAYWDHFSYISATYAWVHAILYCTIIGGVFLEVARCLVPPKKMDDRQDKPIWSWSWHSRHPATEILNWIMVIVLGMVTMFVWLSAIIVALFTEIANESQEWGSFWATLIYCILALILGVTPLAPGTVADAVGGFLLVKIYMHESEGYNFIEAIMIAFAFVTVLHFMGSCLQYWIGKVKTVQEWANFALPPDILAASDSVLLKANCIMVGIVGQVFMDTFSGLNQGRMGMAFCTQFWSEYASLPTAYSWVATGAVLSVQGESGYDWATDAIPICLLMAATWQFLGTTFGGYKLLQANKDEKFWKNKEKWETVQYFSRVGVKATKLGWRNDCFFLAEKMHENSLFDKIQPIHEAYMNKIFDHQQSVRACKNMQKEYNHSRLSARKEHWEKLKEWYFEDDRLANGKLRLKKQYNDWYVICEPVDDVTNQDAWRQHELVFGCTAQMLLVFNAVVLGIYSYLAIAQDIETEVAVQEGIDVLKDISLFAWFVFAIYNIVVVIYYWKSCWSSIASGWHYFLSALFCRCFRESDNQQLETTFRPTWDTTERIGPMLTRRASWL